MREEILSLIYVSEGGFGYSDILDMSPGDRRYYLKAMARLKKEEAEAIRARTPK